MSAARVFLAFPQNMTTTSMFEALYVRQVVRSELHVVHVGVL
jgi:hypothetical protein